jgi:hypothetical protein
MSHLAPHLTPLVKEDSLNLKGPWIIFIHPLIVKIYPSQKKEWMKPIY